ncbi:MAG: FHA domain-containing protein, partial [Proteobacteria bacterium]|nr:FHA domain-containing protein [Pseudomonadota bacterium]
MIVLEILHGTAAQRVHRPAAGTVTTIGRAPTCAITISDYHLSGEHAQLAQIGEHHVFRDLRSTNGSAIERDGRRIPIDAAARWEIALVDGDVILLGNPADPVRIAVRVGDEVEDDLGDRLIASRSILDLARVSDSIEQHDKANALRIYKALQPLGSRLEPMEAYEASVHAAFELLPRATHVAILLRNDADK